ncbi:MAG: LysR family transcriptional regulator [Betaproteobacteria bacterium]
MNEMRSLLLRASIDNQLILVSFQAQVDNRPMPLTRLTFRQIETFVLVSEARSFSAAAAQLGLTVQAVSQLVAEHEATVGFRLLERTTRRVELSSAGRDYLPSAKTVLRHVQAAEVAADDVRNRASGIVRVGAPLVLAATALPAIIQRYTVQRPKVVVRVRDIAVDRLVDTVASGDIDIAIGPDRATGGAASSEPIFDSPWVLWCAASHPLSRRRKIRWDDLRDLPLVAAGRDHELGVGPMRLSAPEDERVTPVDVVDNVTTAFGIAAQGQVATFAPEYVQVLATAFDLMKLRVIEPETVRKVCLYRPLGRALSPAAEGFASFAAVELADWARSGKKLSRRR